MRRLLVTLSLTLGFAASARAGSRSVQPVSIQLASDGSGNFSGNLGDTRASADSRSYLGCELWATAGTSGGYCLAADATRAVQCRIDDPHLVQVAATVNAISRLSVSFDKNGVCTEIRVANYSTHAPMTP